MKVIILSAKGVDELPLKMVKEPQTTLEWLGSAFSKNDFNDINVVGGKDIEKLSLHNLEAKYFYNPKTFLAISMNSFPFCDASVGSTAPPGFSIIASAPS